MCVAVIICNFNKKDFVLNCIKSVFESDFTDFDVIVVDNASSDGSVEAIKEKYDDKLTLLCNEENLGGSGGFNCGMQYAMDKGCYEYIHLLDNDVVIDKYAIRTLYDFMESHDDAGVVGSLICRMDERQIIQDYGAMIDADNLGVRPLHKNERLNDGLPEFLECDYVAACSAMYRSSVLEETGPIDKDFFIYWDDMSLSQEIRLAGHKVYSTKSSLVWHYHSVTSLSSFTTYYFFRNKIRYFTKYLDDYDFDQFCDNLVTRLFRTFAVNRNKQEYAVTYFNALNDALNDVRGKAEEWKMPAPPPLTDFSPDKRVIEVTHVLDEPTYDRNAIYIDRYKNILCGSEDFDFLDSLDAHKSFFYDVFYGFVKGRLEALRKKII